MAPPINVNNKGIQQNIPVQKQAPSKSVSKLSSDGLEQAAHANTLQSATKSKLEKGQVALTDPVVDDPAAALAAAGVFQRLSSKQEGGKFQIDNTAEGIAKAVGFRSATGGILSMADAEMVESGANAQGLLASGTFEERHTQERQLDDMKQQLARLQSAMSGDKESANLAVAGTMQNQVFSKYVSKQMYEKAANVCKTDATENNDPNFHLNNLAMIGLINGGGPEAMPRLNFMMSKMVEQQNFANTAKANVIAGGGFAAGMNKLQNLTSGNGGSNITPGNNKPIVTE